MLEELKIEVIKAMIIGLWGFVWIEMLVAPGQILSILPRLYFRVFDPNNPKHLVVSSALAKPLFECAVCHAGWVAILTNIRAEFFSYYTFVSVVVSMTTAFFVSNHFNR